MDNKILASTLKFDAKTLDRVCDESFLYWRNREDIFWTAVFRRALKNVRTLLKDKKEMRWERNLEYLWAYEVMLYTCGTLRPEENPPHLVITSTGGNLMYEHVNERHYKRYMDKFE